jgi:hypothetical protein
MTHATSEKVSKKVEAMMNIGVRRVSREVLVVGLVAVLGMMPGTSGAQQEDVVEAGKLYLSSLLRGLSRVRREGERRHGKNAHSEAR